MLKYHIENAIYRSLQQYWLMDEIGGTFYRYLGRSDEIDQFEKSINYWSDSLPEYHFLIEELLDGKYNQEPPTSRSRYLMLYIDSLSDWGSLKITESPSQLLWPDGQVLVNREFKQELQVKKDHAFQFLLTEPLNWYRKLIPIDDDVINLILNDPKLFCMKPAGSYISGSFMTLQPIPLGLWSQLWQSYQAVFKCSECEGQVLTIQAARGIGDGVSRGICSSCGRLQKSIGTNDWNKAFEALKLLQPSSQKPYRIDQGVKVILERLRRAIDTG